MIHSLFILAIGWKKVFGTERSWDNNGRWISWYHFPEKKKPYVVETIKDGVIDILGRFKTKTQAINFLNKWKKKHPKG